MTSVEALALLLRSVQGRRSTWNADQAAALISEYEDRGALVVERSARDGRATHFVRIELVTFEIERPAWWLDGDEGTLTE